MFRAKASRIAGVGGDIDGRGAVEVGGPRFPETQAAVQTAMLDGRDHELEPARNEVPPGRRNRCPDVLRALEDVGLEAEAANLIADHDVGALREASRDGNSRGRVR